MVEHIEHLWAGRGWGHSFVSSAVTTVGRRGTMSTQLGVVRTTLQRTQVWEQLSQMAGSGWLEKNGEAKCPEGEDSVWEQRQ